NLKQFLKESINQLIKIIPFICKSFFRLLMTIDMILEARNIHKSYPGVKVLKGIDFQVEKGEIVSIIGASGAGKSTLLQILGTLDIPDQGSIHLDGQDLLSLRGKRMARFRNAKIGFVFQFHHLLPEFTALENICLPAFLGQAAARETREKARGLMELLGIQERAEHLPSAMSGGEQQRTAIARALINDPKVVFADEPSGNLDSQNSRELHKLFLDLREKFQQTFIIVTHNEELAHMSDRKVEMKDGTILHS
ncbi:MAG: ABC transporter ATP-binding protein, partial [Bacteroidota bacterium]